MGQGLPGGLCGDADGCKAPPEPAGGPSDGYWTDWTDFDRARADWERGPREREWMWNHAGASTRRR